MPKIRKKTSKRGKTHQRSKIKHKVSESRKKAKKEAKKNPQWKSKHAKDPGIPNNFPYKDQILAEVAEQRRRDEEVKLKRKEEKKQQKSADAEDEDDETEKTAFDGITSVDSSTIRAITASSKGKAKVEVIDSEDDEDAPILMNSEYANLKSILDKVDVIVHVLDARDPMAFQSEDLQNYVKGRENCKLIYVLTKIDSCPRESTQSWATLLRKSHPVFLFRSASAFLPSEKSGGSSKSDAVGADVLLKALHSWVKGSDVHVALVGIGNSGKSSLLNSLLEKSVSPIYKASSVPPTPSTTERPLEIPFDYAGKHFVFIDSPAIAWRRSENLTSDQVEISRSRDVLLRSKGKIERIKEPIAPISYIVSRADAQDLMVFYNLPAFTKGDTTAFLSALAKKHSLVKKKGVLDLHSAARIVLRDWNSGKFARYVHPPNDNETSEKRVMTKNDISYAELYEKDSSLLQFAPSKKDMRKGNGLIRLSVEHADSRPIVMEEPWDISDSDEETDDGSESLGTDEIEDEDENVDEGSNSLHSDDEDEEDSEEEAETEIIPVNVGKRKRQAKKVAFAPVRKVTNTEKTSKNAKPVIKKRR